MSGNDRLPRREEKRLERLGTPENVQDFLDGLAYNKDSTCLSPIQVLRERRAHCLEGALVAAAALELQGHPPLLVDLAAVRDDDHILAVFRRNGCWGAVAKSNYAGLRYRTPVYRTLRELVMSYFEHYYNPRGEKTLRGYSKPVSLRRFPRWRTAEDAWEIALHLVDLPHTPVMESGQRYFMDKRLYAAGRVGAVK